jgi:hypothetical protein
MKWRAAQSAPKKYFSNPIAFPKKRSKMRALKQNHLELFMRL